MSYSTKVQLQGKNLTVIYGANQLPLAATVKKWGRAREVRRHLSRTRGKYVLVMSNEGEGIEVWWSAEDKGVSIAASLDHWFLRRLREDEHTPDDVVVVIPFDRRIYLAELRGGLVHRETIVAEETAAEQLELYAAEERIIHAFEAGRCTDLVQQYVRPEPLPFVLGEHQFRHALPVFIMNGLYHPGLILPLMLLLGAAALTQFDFDRIRSLVHASAAVRPSEAVIQSVMVPEVTYGGGTVLRELVRWITLSEALHGDGLQSVQFSPPTQVVLAGRAAQYPLLVKQFAERHGGEFRYNSAGWVVAMEMAMMHPNQAKPMQTQVMLQQMSAGWPALKLVEGPVPGLLTTTRFKVDHNSINTWDLIEIARRLDGFPTTISALSCNYDNYRLAACAIRIDAKTL